MNPSAVPAHDTTVVRWDAAATWQDLADAARALTGVTRVLVVRVDPGGWPDPTVADLQALRYVLDCLSRAELVTVGVLAGRVTGVPLRLALACDLLVCADDVALRWFPDPQHGWVSPLGLERLVELLGTARATRLAVGGVELGAAEVVEHGLVGSCVPRAGLDTAVEATVARALEQDRNSSSELKALLRMGNRSSAAVHDAVERLAASDPGGSGQAE